MAAKTAIEIANNPKYQKFIKTRAKLSWTLTIVMMIVYFGYIYLVAFEKDFMSRTLGEGVTTLSIPLGLGVIVFTILITGFYVQRANSEYDPLIEEITKESQR